MNRTLDPALAVIAGLGTSLARIKLRTLLPQIYANLWLDLARLAQW
jgi:hypothetical protein